MWGNLAPSIGRDLMGEMSTESRENIHGSTIRHSAERAEKLAAKRIIGRDVDGTAVDPNFAKPINTLSY